MGPTNGFIVRLTESQQRFEVLWKKRKRGEPTLKELAEMDALINRDPMIHEFVLNEMENSDTPPRDGGQKAAPATAQEKLTKKLRSFFKQWNIVFSPMNKVADVTIPVRGNHMEEVWTRSSLA